MNFNPKKVILKANNGFHKEKLDGVEKVKKKEVVFVLEEQKLHRLDFKGVC